MAKKTKGFVCPPRVKTPLPHPEIKHLIVLMLENRSFDHMLGFSGIPGVDGIDDPDKFTNQNSAGHVFRISDDASPTGLPDPGHDFEDVCKQLYWKPGMGDKNGVDLWREAHLTGLEPAMKGFVRSYEKYKDDDSGHVMKCFNQVSTPVLTRLAREFAVCNYWYSSIPGPTLPNRLFAHAGWSHGRLDMSAEDFNISPTVYEILDCANVSSTIYADGWTAAATFWNLMQHQDQFFGTLDNFYQDCYDNNLPSYCFLEPRYSAGVVDGVFRPQNDQHPDSDVAEGEQLIYSIYKAIRSNRKVWESSMFVIVYDEHGGLYDHVVPPAATPPQDCTDPTFGFAFDRYGVRVPAVIVSPFTNHVVLNQTFDHTSLVATARKLFTGQYQDSLLGNRAAGVNTLDLALNRDPKTDGPRNQHIEFAPRPVNRGEQDQEHLQRGLNHLQVAHLKQALLVNEKLPASLQYQPKWVTENGLSKNSPDDQFSNIKQQDADHYVQSIYASARHAGGPKVDPQKDCKP